MALPDRITRPRRGLRGRWRLRRRLAGIAKGLTKDATLAAKFAMFNALTKGEPPSAPGKIVPFDGTKVIQPLETGIVKAIQKHLV